MAKTIIFSTESDQSATEVIRRLSNNENCEVLRINTDSRLGDFSISAHRYEFNINDVTVRMEDVHAVWFRKGNFWFNNFFRGEDVNVGLQLSIEVRKILKLEEQRTRALFHQLLMKAPRALGNPVIGNPNKLIFMEYARSVGLKTPEFLISNCRDTIADYAKQNCVTKGISEGLYFWDKEDTQRGYFSYTEDFDPEALNILPRNIAPSILQKKIDKEIELRVFYIDGLMFTMAIFSQNDSQTSTDFRKYNQNRPNRMVPFFLKDDIQEKVRSLFSKVELNTGSLDLIIDKRGDYYFLEINPYGQYEWVSWACNYDLDQHIADWLIRKA